MWPGRKMLKLANNKWKPPSEDIYKINTDGTFDQKTRIACWGFVVWNKHGEVLSAGTRNVKYAASALHAKDTMA